MNDETLSTLAELLPGGGIDVYLRDFDPAFYLAQYPEVAESGLDCALHYALYGWKEGRDPSPDFSTAFYLKDNPDVASAGIDPFWHYVTDGRNEGRAGLPPAADMASLDPALRAEINEVRDHFDPAFYLGAYPDIAETGADPLIHYMMNGWKEGRDPSPVFSTSFYLKDNPDVVDAGVNPFWHYVTDGRKEGRPAAPPSPDLAMLDSATLAELSAVSEFFDPAHYLRTYPQVAESGRDPLVHFMVEGWKSGHNPSPAFSTVFYLENNPDVARAGVNPFWHYLVAGQHEGREPLPVETPAKCPVAETPGPAETAPAETPEQAEAPHDPTGPHHPGGYRVQHLLRQLPLEETVGHWTRATPKQARLTADEIVTALRTAAGARLAWLILSVGHDDYRTNPGGIQVCIQREERLAAERGAVYVNLHPVQPLPRLAHAGADDDPLVTLVANGATLGIAPTSALIAATATLRPEAGRIDVVIHQMLGHLPERITELVTQATPDARCWLWLHDYLTICPSYALQRNNIAYCGAPPVGSNACSICLFGAERRAHATRMAALFDALDVHVLSPSQVTADIWTATSGLTPASLTVCPHMTLDWVARPDPRPVDDGPITLAFLGTPVPFKGWLIFERLVRRLGQNMRFVYCGARPVDLAGIEHVPVHVTADTPDAMIDAVAEQRIDLVLHWATWPETFSLSCYEALAGGAHVLTNPVSGNVAATVDRLDRGAVLADEEALLAFFEDGRAAEMVDRIRARRAGHRIDHALSDISLAALEPQT
ncbi:hypothetical protein [Marinibacterium sp. SX1]|uniref:hypothetical protein n=1 Tax=Marinibacterium sp. SX1 TaxID=3388424 RepID=UPI003D1807C6